MVALNQHPMEQLEFARGLKQPGVCVERSLEQFDPISLEEMEHVSLLDRTDTKYIMRVSQLNHILDQIVAQYRVLKINGMFLNHYQTLYFDTSDFALYRQHHNGLRSRYKVRVREYVDSDLAFWEVKSKTNQERTIKSRLKAADSSSFMEEQVNEFIDAHVPLDFQELEPKLWNRFLRVTLVSNCHQERLTLDMNLEFGWNNAYATLPGIAIAEVKQSHASQLSNFIQQMRQLGMRPARFSKYCAGVYLLYDGVKINNFKPRMRLVEKLMQEEMIHEYVR
jgi:SPX domain protein involved in polyphosphate accumulation